MCRVDDANESALNKPDAPVDEIVAQAAPCKLPAKVLRAYFARRTESKLYEDVKITVDKSNIRQLSQKHKHLKVGSVVTERRERKEKDIRYVRSNLAYVGEQVYIVVETADLRADTVSVEILGSSSDNSFLKVDEAGSFIQGGSVKAKFDGKVGALSNDASNANAVTLIDTAVLEVALKPLETPATSDTQRKEWGRKIEAIPDKAALLHLRITAKSSGGCEIHYSNEDETITAVTKDKGIFLNKTNEWFKLKFCDCGNKYNADIRCTKYSPSPKVDYYGPVYKGNNSLEDYSEWTSIIAAGQLTTEEKEILIMVSDNEGKNFDAIQSYDSEIVTLGVMQKTIDPFSKGQLYDQFKRFKTNYPEKWRGLMEDCKWSLSESEGVIYDGLSGATLKSKIREGFGVDQYNSKKSVPCKPLEPLINLSKDADFQKQQVTDFIQQLREVLAKVPTGYSNSLSIYLITKLGKATALDQYVNRPSKVIGNFGESLDRFYASHPKVSKDPTLWGSDHATYEGIILEDYGKTRKGTDMIERYEKLKSRL